MVSNLSSRVSVQFGDFTSSYWQYRLRLYWVILAIYRYRAKIWVPGDSSNHSQDVKSLMPLTPCLRGYPTNKRRTKKWIYTISVVRSLEFIFINNYITILVGIAGTVKLEKVIIS